MFVRFTQWLITAAKNIVQRNIEVIRINQKIFCGWSGGVAFITVNAGLADTEKRGHFLEEY